MEYLRPMLEGQPYDERAFEACLAQIREEFDPKEMVQPDRVMGLDDMMAEAIKFKYMPQPLTEAQLKDLIQIP